MVRLSRKRAAVMAPAATAPRAGQGSALWRSAASRAAGALLPAMLGQATR